MPEHAIEAPHRAVAQLEDRIAAVGRGHLLVEIEDDVGRDQLGAAMQILDEGGDPASPAILLAVDQNATAQVRRFRIRRIRDPFDPELPIREAEQTPVEIDETLLVEDEFQTLIR